MHITGSVLFRQTRVGLNKRQFQIYKFRTMVANAEQIQDELLPMNEMAGPVFKITNDPRVTPLGRILRKTSIDELPQLFNVLKGEMSLVGPRAMSLRDYQLFDQDWQRRRFSVKPGITCLWQVNGRSSIPFRKMDGTRHAIHRQVVTVAGFQDSCKNGAGSIARNRRRLTTVS